MSKKIKHLVVDTTAFIKAANLQDVADNMYTVQEVVDEILNDRQRRKLVVLPYNLIIKDVYTENIKFVTAFSKKTGDYTSLSATDMKVMALTYQMEKQEVGTEHLKTEPVAQRTIKVNGTSGFVLQPVTNDKINNAQNENKTECKDSPKSNEETVESTKSTDVSENEDKNIQKEMQDIKENNDDDDDELTDELAKQIENMDLQDEKKADEFIVRIVEDETNSDNEESSHSEDSDSDGGDWVTPRNIAMLKKQLGDGEFEEKSVEVACMTSDFAMQNVLKQIGLNVTAVDGRIIKQVRTYIFRCTTCFKTTSVMTKLFCSKCGHASLKKVAVSVDDEGNQQIHINGRKPLTGRGKRFSLPTPRGGLHFQYPILTEDQHINKNFATKMARKKTDALNPDYIAGYSPFVTKDVNSKSAVLGARVNKQDIKYWMTHHYKGKKK